VGGSDRVPTFVALIGAQRGLNIATLIDIQRKDEQTIENLYKKRLLKKKNVLTFADFTAAKEADIEDMFEPDFYLELVNGEYAKSLTTSIALADLDANLPRLLVRLEKHFEANPLKGANGFSHLRPARYLTDNFRSLKAQVSDATLSRFEEAFKALNALLKKSD
jgi:hypothetical protein